MKKLEDVKNLLVVVDVINGFIREGNMKDSYIERIIPGVETLVKEYVNKESSEVFYIKDAHNLNSIEFKKFPMHCVDGSSESEVVDELKPYEIFVSRYSWEWGLIKIAWNSQLFIFAFYRFPIVIYP